MFVWTNVLKVYKLVVKLTNVEKVHSYVVKLTNVCKTCDLTAQWTENVSKYKIEQLSVSLTLTYRSQVLRISGKFFPTLVSKLVCFWRASVYEVTMKKYAHYQWTHSWGSKFH